MWWEDVQEGNFLLSYAKSQVLVHVSLDCKPHKCVFRGMTLPTLMRQETREKWRENNALPSFGIRFFPCRVVLCFKKKFFEIFYKDCFFHPSTRYKRGKAFLDFHCENLVVFLEVKPTKTWESPKALTTTI